MGDRMQQLWSQLAAFFMSLPPARRVAIAAVGAVSLAGVLGLAWWVQRPLMRPLFTNLAQEDAGAIVEALRAEKVPFEIDDGGHAVLVPAEKLYELRLALAGRGLPAGGGVGFEIFDKQTLGQTDFLQRLNYQRALQGELGRTVAGLGGVESARVHLALPERSLFVTEDRKPSASVVVKLAPGRALSRAQIDGIVHLVAASVEGLAAESVTVVDEGGRMLTADRRDAETGGGGSALEYQRTVEHATEERIESMLGAVVGRDKTIARVSTTLDFAHVERTEETFDPDKTAIRTSHTTKEQTVGAHAASGGPPGVQSNLTNEPGVNEGGGSKSDRKDESQSYEISKVVSRTVGPVGAVKQLSVAVLIDGLYTEEGGKRTFTPRPQEELDRLKELVKSAIGFNEQRGDKIEMASVPFQAEPMPAGEGSMGVVWRWAPSVLTRLLGVAFAAAMLLWVVRPVILGLAGRREGGAALPAAGRGALTGMDAAMAELAHHNLALAQQNPERAARLVRQWLLESSESGSRSA